MINQGIYNEVVFSKETGDIKKDQFNVISDIYTWRIDKQNTNDVFYTMTFNYEDNEKAWPFIIDYDTVTPLLGTRNVENNTITVQVPKEGSIGLMTYNNNFNDIESHWSKDIVELLASRMIINGYTDNTFKPDNTISRAEFITMLVKSIEGKQSSNESIFKDVDKNNWASPYITRAYNNGWISGNSNNQFFPNTKITREQIVSILMRVHNNLAGEIETQNIKFVFEDTNQISNYARESMKQAVQLGIIQGYENKLNPQGKASRAEAAVFLSRFLELLNKL